MRRRQGMSLVEILIGMSIATGLIYVLVSLLVSGSKLFSKGVGASRGPEAALIVMDQIERDLIQCLQIPGDPRAPVSSQGKELGFFVPAPDLPLDALEVIGVPIRWHLVQAPGGGFHPARNEHRFSSLEVLDWEFEVLEPDPVARPEGWYVIVRVTFAAESKVSKSYQTSRLVFLAQPSANFLYFPDFGDTLLPPVRVKMVASPSSKLFANLGPAGGPSS